MYRIVSLVILLLFIIPYVTASETDLLRCSTFKLTVISEGEEIEWEYENPDEFEIEIGNKVVKGIEAKKEITTLYNKLALTKDTDVNQIVETIKDHGYEEIDKLVVKLKLHDEQLWTWNWKK